jgi:hypothetical protein
MDETREELQLSGEIESVTNLGAPRSSPARFGYFPGSGQAIADPSFLAFSKSARRSCFIALSCG